MKLPKEAYEEFNELLELQGIELSPPELIKAADKWVSLYDLVAYPKDEDDRHD